MKTIASFLTVLLIGMATTSCTIQYSERTLTGPAPTSPATTIPKKSDIENFTSLDCSVAAEIIYTQDRTTSIEWEIPETIADRIEYKIRDKCLYIRYKKNPTNISSKYGNIRCRISSPQLQEIGLHGATRFTSSTPIESDHFKLNSNGSSVIRISDLSCNTFEADLRGASRADLTIHKATQALIKNSGAGMLKVSAQAQNTQIHNKGAGKIDARLTGDRISLENRGAGKCSVTVDCKKLTGENRGAGQCIISGTADEVDLDKSGVSRFDVSKLNQ